MMVCMIGSGAVSEVMAEMTAQMLMHREVMSRMLVMEPMRAIPVLFFVLLHVHPQLIATVEVFGLLLLDERQVPLREKS